MFSTEAQTEFRATLGYIWKLSKKIKHENQKLNLKTYDIKFDIQEKERNNDLSKQMLLH